jgi:hypothetical protein
MQVNKPHPNAEIIKAWADGKAIQFQSMDTGKWIDLGGPDDADPHVMPWDSTLCNWRVKPEPKPDVIMYGHADITRIFDYNPPPKFFDSNLKLTFDGETGELKAAEVI